LDALRGFDMLWIIGYVILYWMYKKGTFIKI
jgi:hypothetical protein